METKIFGSVSGGAEAEADAGAESETPTETGREIEPAPVARGSLEQPMHNGGDEGVLALLGALPASAAGAAAVAAAGDADPRDCTMADVFEAMPHRRAGKAGKVAGGGARGRVGS